MSLEETAAEIGSRVHSLTKESMTKAVLEALLAERRAQEALWKQQLGQAAPDMKGLRKANGELVSKVTRMGKHMATLELLTVRQRQSNREDRETCYRLIVALEACAKEGSKTAVEALALLDKERPSLKKQMKTWKP